MVVSALSLEDPAATNSVSRFGLCHGSGAVLSQVMGWGLSQRKQAARQCELSLRSQALWTARRLARRLYQGAVFSMAVKAELFKQAEEKQAPSSC